VEFSLDRFHALLQIIGRRKAMKLTENLQHPDDLLFVLDAVHFSLNDGRPYFADYAAANWLPYAAEWPNGDREALKAWLASDSARLARTEAIDYIKALVLDDADKPTRYPYLIPGTSACSIVHKGSMLRQ
jgi:hypothetical protein